MRIKIGTRNSALALWQANFVAGQLNNAGFETELMPMETIGDKKLEVTIAKIGSKGVFTEELENALLSGEIHIAVHSAKDMQSSLGPNLEILAFGEREAEYDVVVSHNPDFVFGKDKPMVIGTSSTRRKAQLARNYPNVKTVETRGNLQTRIRKMEEGHCEAMILAAAGVIRMGYTHLIRQELNLTDFIPAVGQGSIAIECATSLSPEIKLAVRKACNHELTEIGMLAERSFLNTLQGGCSIPVFGRATVAYNKFSLRAGLISLNGEQEIITTEDMVFETENLGNYRQDAIALGQSVGQQILANGGRQLLDEIKAELGRN